MVTIFSNNIPSIRHNPLSVFAALAQGQIINQAIYFFSLIHTVDPCSPVIDESLIRGLGKLHTLPSALKE